MATTPSPKQSKYVSYPELHALTGYSRSHLRVLKSRGALPPTIYPAFPVWLRKDIMAWWEKKKANPQDDNT